MNPPAFSKEHIIFKLEAFCAYQERCTQEVRMKLDRLGADESLCLEVIKHLKEKDFASVRKWAATTEIDSTTFFRKLYDNLYDIMKPSSIPQIVIILADYQYKQAFVADQEINLVACLTQIMADGEFK